MFCEVSTLWEGVRSLSSPRKYAADNYNFVKWFLVQKCKFRNCENLMLLDLSRSETGVNVIKILKFKLLPLLCLRFVVVLCFLLQLTLVINSDCCFKSLHVQKLQLDWLHVFFFACWCPRNEGGCLLYTSRCV